MIPELITIEQIREMTTTELHALLTTTHLTNAQLRAIRAELKARVI